MSSKRYSLVQALAFFQDDKSYLAIDRKNAKSSLSTRKHHEFR